MLAPGGFIVEETDTAKLSRTDVCVFCCEETPEKIRGFYEVSMCEHFYQARFFECMFLDECMQIFFIHKHTKI